jgi:hypothetical protein
VPFTGNYRPSAVAWGVVGLYLLLAVEITSLLRHRISRRMWRWTHSLSFLLFAFATMHGLTAGSDGSSAPLRISMIVVSAVVAGLTAASVDNHLRTRKERQARNTPIRSGPAGRRPSFEPAPLRSIPPNQPVAQASPLQSPGYPAQLPPPYRSGPQPGPPEQHGSAGHRDEERANAR